MDDSIQWNTDAMSALLPMVKKLGGGLKSKTLCMQLLKHGRRKTTAMLSQPEVLKAEYKRAKNGPVLQRQRTDKRRTQKRKASRRRKLEDTVIPFTHRKRWFEAEYEWESVQNDHADGWYSSDEERVFVDDYWMDRVVDDYWITPRYGNNNTNKQRWNDTFGRCRGCNCGQPHNNPYFCDDNFRQREHDSWENLRDKD